MPSTTRNLALALAVAALGLAPASRSPSTVPTTARRRRRQRRSARRPRRPRRPRRDDSGGGDDDRKGERRVAGSCTGGSTAKLKAKHDDGRLETEFEVDQNRNGVTWTVRIRRNGSHAVKTTRHHHGAERLLLGRAQDRRPGGQRPHHRQGDQPVGRGLQGERDGLSGR